jgi:hypothetical protein
MAERLATLEKLQGKRKGPQLLLTTANAATQRNLTPFRIRQLTRRLAEGERIERDRLVELLQANGYQRTDAVHDAGEYAVRGSIVDLFPAGESQALRLDFFGDEIETMRGSTRRPAVDRQGRLLHPDAGQRGAARRGDGQALPRPLPRAVRRQCHRRPALPGDQRRAAAGRDGALAAAARGKAGHAVRPSRRG